MERCRPCLILPFALLSLLQCSLAARNPVLVESWKVTSDIRFRFATTQIRSVFYNRDRRYGRQARFHVVLPSDAFISNFSMEIDGVVSVGVVKSVQEAMEDYKAYQQRPKNYSLLYIQRLEGEVNVGMVKSVQEAVEDYEAAKQRGKSAGPLNPQPRDAYEFDYSVELGLQRVVFTLTYQEVLRRKFGRYDHVIHLPHDQNVRHLAIDVTIQDTQELTTLEIPDCYNSLAPHPDAVDMAVVDKPTPTSATIQYERFLEPHEHYTSPTFTVRYDVKPDFSAGTVLVVDGYFIHSFAPPSLPAIPKDIIFVLDVSGSMTGRKINQLQEAMTSVVQEMQGQDRFNILTFHGDTQFWRHGRLTPADSQGKREALEFLSGIETHNGTNILASLTEALQFLLEFRDARHVPVLLLLTDGLPSLGSSRQVASHVTRLNAGVASIHCLAFGAHADFHLLKRLSSQNAGVARRIYESSQADLQVAGFYDEISRVTLDKLQIAYVSDSVDQDSLSQADFRNLVNTSEVMVAGRLINLRHLIDVVIQAVVAQEEVNLVLEDDGILTDVILPYKGHGLSDVSSLSSMVEKSWAFLTVRKLLQKRLRSEVYEEREAIDKGILELSLKYNLVTPLTAMVVKRRIPHFDFDARREGQPLVFHCYFGNPPISTSAPQQEQGAALSPASTLSPPPPTTSAPSPTTSAPSPTTSAALSTTSAAPGLPGRGDEVKKRLVGKGSRGRKASRGKKSRRRNKKPRKTCKYLFYANLEFMDLAGPSLTSPCHVVGPSKFVSGDYTLFLLDNGVSVEIYASQGMPNINGLMYLIIKQGENFTEISLYNNAAIRRLGNMVLNAFRLGDRTDVVTPEFELRVQGTEKQTWLRRCTKWFSYTISILLRVPLNETVNANKSIFPDACTTPISDEFLGMRKQFFR